MDWSKTQTIFIIVFLILNMFLYSLYIDRKNAAQDLDIIADKSLEVRLKEDRITMEELPEIEDGDLYISGKRHKFTLNEVADMPEQNFYVEDTGYTLTGTLNQPQTLKTIDAESLTEFVEDYVYLGDQFTLWEIDEDEQRAIFFQKTSDRPIYYEEDAVLEIEWNKDNLIRMYKMSMLTEMEPFEHQAPLVEPVAVIEKLYLQKLLEPKDHIKAVSIGYTFMSALSQREVFVATWEVHVENKELQTEESFFVNAVDGTILNITPSERVDDERKE
ncbi:two-component system regulatory protein YycI [Caryophanon tenue]|uniref:Regulatory protein YycH-like domain-containing protein n=1 Tax=Caryophanon tenue TaxID=33978 RepID=A0A1C0YL70_9BACL|nr:two-component system regulatory protein YycI [Caryophanon tenue]OCS87922.1 hypothetical protein A6M13_08090 [Caryophanon tenue]